ncbi:MAG: hypothetical protein CVU77_05640 [Elusimicrobia bacterium HGW-Elusimicrobia-1]|jgi:hypothetical protein|nr:MAG: hypothetical protein CVU77_05640 [Elusimicrobia bacterium HGW-Elusimicrobia-1]
MNTLIAVCLVVATISATVSAVYLIMTLIQMRRTAAEAEALLAYLNLEVRKVGNIGDTIASAVSSVASSALFLKIPYVAKIAVGAVGALAAMIMRRKKNSDSTCCAGEAHNSKK